jgi:virginiamycin B lyase
MLLAFGVALLVVSVAQAAPIGTLKQFRVRTAKHLANGNGVTVSGTGVFFAAFNTNSIWRYDTASGVFTEFPIPTAGATPSDVATAADGAVWFSEAGANRLGRLDPATGAVTEFALPGGPNGPRGITIATDGKVWFTKRFDHTAASSIRRRAR